MQNDCGSFGRPTQLLPTCSSLLMTVFQQLSFLYISHKFKTMFRGIMLLFDLTGHLCVTTVIWLSHVYLTTS